CGWLLTREHPIRVLQPVWDIFGIGGDMNYGKTALKAFQAAAVLAAILRLPVAAQQKQTASPASGTQIVFLGTGNPAANPDRSGPATAIVVNGTPYLVDFGS